MLSPSANVSPVYKNGPKFNPENHGPISLTCSKLLEHTVVRNIMAHADTSNILYICPKIAFENIGHMRAN